LLPNLFRYLFTFSGRKNHEELGKEEFSQQKRHRTRSCHCHYNWHDNRISYCSNHLCKQSSHRKHSTRRFQLGQAVHANSCNANRRRSMANGPNRNGSLLKQVWNRERPERDTEIYSYMPVSYYSVSNRYFSQVWPSQVLNPVNNGSSAPVATVFAVEKVPMSDGSYIRVVAAPVIRLMNSTIVTQTNSTFYFNLYLPVLSLTSSPRLSQSVTLKGNSISIGTQNTVSSISVTVSFPTSGFDNTFFHFPRTTELITAPQRQGLTCVAQLYTGSVAVSLGANV
jgi:hypothetical protein